MVVQGIILLALLATASSEAGKYHLYKDEANAKYVYSLFGLGQIAGKLLILFLLINKQFIK
jgi:Mn2+/Fe2+ NRAMP family transporter